MEKMMWTKPELNEVAFAANEYVAACGEEEQVYSFICDAGGGDYGGLYNDSWQLVSNSSYSFHACGTSHDAPLNGVFIDGWFDKDRNHNNGNEIDVKIWEATENVYEDRWVQTGPYWGDGYYEKVLVGTRINRHATTQQTFQIVKS